MKRLKYLFFFLLGIVFIVIGVRDIQEGTLFMDPSSSSIGMSIKSPFFIILIGIVFIVASVINVFRDY